MRNEFFYRHYADNTHDLMSMSSPDLNSAILDAKEENKEREKCEFNLSKINGILKRVRHNGTVETEELINF